MKKLVIAASALLLSLGVNAQDDKAGGFFAPGSTIGGVATTTVVAGVVGVAVVAAIVSNSSSTSVDPVDPVKTCNTGDAAPVNGICTGTTTTVTGTGTGTTTATVTFTYPAIVQ